MKKNENTKPSSAAQIIALIIFVIAFLSMAFFTDFILTPKSAAANAGNGVASAAEAAKISTTISAISGLIAQIQVLLSVFVVLAIQKKGYIAAICLWVLSLGTALRKVLIMKIMHALPGTVIPFSALFLLTIVYFFSRKITQKNEELQKNYNQIMETNRIIREKDEKLSYLAYYDILTNLPNRHLFIEKMDENILNNSNMPFSVILADLDNFKNINNIYGSASGDVLLATYAEKLKAFCGDSIFLGRVGGNEYGFIIQGNMSEPNILNYIEKIQNIISEPVQIGNDMISSTASFGIASYPNNAVNSSDMLKCINSAVLYAKANGKNRPCFYEQY